MRLPSVRRAMFRTLSFLVIVAGAPVAARAQTAMFRADAAHSGRYAGGGPVLVGLAWRVMTGGDVVSSPVIADGTVYVGSNDGTLYALDLRTGAERWRRALGSPVGSSPAVGEGLVYAQTRDGVLYAVDAATGGVRWQRHTGRVMRFPWGHESGDYYTSSPVYTNGTVVFGAADGGVYALAARTGTLRWHAQTAGRIRGTPAVADGRVYVGAFDGRVYCFTLANGAPIWTAETEGAALNSGDFGFDRRSIQSSPAVAYGMVFVGARDGFLYALDAATGTRRWRYDHKISWVITSPAVQDGIVYDGSSDGRFLQAVDTAGTEQSRAPAAGIVWSSPAVTDSLVYFGDGSGRLWAVDRASGTTRWTFHAAGRLYASPAVAGDLVIFGSTDGAVYAVRADHGVPVQRAVYYDSTVGRRAHAAHPALARDLAARGYTTLDTAALGDFLTARLGDGAPSVIVFAMDYLPARVGDGPGATSLFRRYLESGGKIVWTTLPPHIIPGPMPEGKLVFDWEAPAVLTGVPHDSALFDPHGVSATAVGLRWGLPARWHDAWSVDTAGVSEVLGLDDTGLAAAWVKRFGGPPGTGFVRVPAADPFAVYLAAEYRDRERR